MPKGLPAGLHAVMMMAGIPTGVDTQLEVIGVRRFMADGCIRSVLELDGHHLSVA